MQNPPIYFKKISKKRMRIMQKKIVYCKKSEKGARADNLLITF